MGDADKPNAKAMSSSPYIDKELLPPSKNIDLLHIDLFQANASDRMSEEVRTVIRRLHHLSIKSSRKGERLSRRFFWHYFRDELEKLRLKKEMLRELRFRESHLSRKD